MYAVKGDVQYSCRVGYTSGGIASKTDYIKIKKGNENEKIVSLFLCIAMLLTLSATAFAWNNPEGASIPMKATENVNLRNGPGTNYTALGLLNRGDKFYATDDSHSPWYAGYPGEETNLYAYYGWIKGYVNSNYLGPL